MAKNSPANEGDIRDIRDMGPSQVGEDPMEEGMGTHFTILAWRIAWAEESWWATVHGVTKSQTQLSN